MSKVENKSSPNPFDPKALTVSQTGGESFGSRIILKAVPVRKPKPKEWVRSHPSDKFTVPVALLDDAEGNPPYIVTPRIAAAFRAEIRRAELRFAINRQGTVFLWRVPAPDPDARENLWNTTHRIAADEARSKWIRMVSNRSLGAYDIYDNKVDFGDPEWPDYTLEKLLEVAFAGRLIEDPDHILLKQLMGLA
jgi:hypothetical protein